MLAVAVVVAAVAVVVGYVADPGAKEMKLLGILGVQNRDRGSL